MASPFNWPFIRDVGPLTWAWRWGWWQISKRLLGRDPEMALPTGLTMTLPRFSGSAAEVWVTGGNVDWGSEAKLAAFAAQGRDVLDIGAHAGYYALTLAPAARRVYAFEPDGRNLPGLRRNAARAGTVEVVAKAVGRAPGRARFDTGGDSAVSHLSADSGEEVEVVSVDSFVAATPGCDPAVIKIDVEGFDLDVLLGAEATLSRCRPVVLTEFNPAPGNDPAVLSALAARLNYRLCAFARPPGAPKADLRFQTIAMQRLGTELEAKMLFLIPNEIG